MIEFGMPLMVLVCCFGFSCFAAGYLAARRRV